VRRPGKRWLRSGPSAVRPAAVRAVRRPGKRWLRGGVPGTSMAGSLLAGPGRGWLRSGVSAAVPATARTARTPGRGWLGSAGGRGGGLAAAASAAGPRSVAAVLAARSAPSGLSARTAGPRRSPRRGWLGGTSRPPRSALGAAFRGNGGSRGMRASAFRGDSRFRPNWYASSPSGAWLRRSRHPWRKRSRRLLRLVGVGR